MKKITIIALLVAFLGLNFGFSAETATMTTPKSSVETVSSQNPTNIFGKLKTNIVNIIGKAQKDKTFFPQSSILQGAST